tara:strand:+ start:292 stop:918 length:627 start_codon:yes stop_codon:yes gene_type:complete
MASNETIQNLATLLGALKDFNQPRREAEAFASRALIELNSAKELAKYRYDLDVEEKNRGKATLMGAFGGASVIQGPAMVEAGKKAKKGSEALTRAGENQYDINRHGGVLGVPVNRQRTDANVGAKNALSSIEQSMQSVSALLERDPKPGDPVYDQIKSIYTDNYELVSEVSAQRKHLSSKNLNRLNTILSSNSQLSALQIYFDSYEGE